MSFDRRTTKRPLIVLILSVVFFVYLTAARWMAAMAPHETPAQASREANPIMAGLASKVLYITAFQHGLAGGSDDPAMARIYSLLDEKASKPEDMAAGLLEDSLTDSPDDNQTRCRLAIIQYEAGHRETATQNLERVKADKTMAPLASAIQMVYTTPLLPPSAVGDIEKVLTDSLRVWYRDASLQKLYQISGQTSKKQVILQTMEEHGKRDLVILVSVGVFLGFNLLGGCIILFLAAIGYRSVAALRDPNVVPRWDWADGWLLFVFWEVIQVLISVVYRFVPRTMPLLLAGQVGIYGLTLVGFFWMLRASDGATPSNFGLHVHKLYRSILLGVATYMAALPVILVSGLLMRAILKHSQTSDNPVFSLFQNPPGGIKIFAFYLLVGVVGPAFEELLFRGVLLSSFRQVMRPWAAILLSAAIFSVVHADLPGLLPILILGSFMGYIFNKTGSLVPSFVMHSMQNSLTFLFTLFLVT